MQGVSSSRFGHGVWPQHIFHSKHCAQPENPAESAAICDLPADARREAVAFQAPAGAAVAIQRFDPVEQVYRSVIDLSIACGGAIIGREVDSLVRRTWLERGP